MSDALAFVATKFASKRRTNTDIPYLSHLLQVAAWVMERGGTEDQALAGLLHDYLEDIPGATREEVAERFGEPVGRMVAALSDSTGPNKPEWKERKAAYLERLKTEPPDVKLVSACDKLHNATCILRDLKATGNAVWNRFSAGRDETLWYYRELVAALGNGWDDPAVAELADRVDAIHREAGV